MSYLDNIGLGTLWSRIMTALGVKEDKATIVNHGTSDTTFALTPNVLHTWGTINSLTLSLASGSSTYVDGYWFKFTAGDSFTVLTLPTGVAWAAEPEIEVGKTYEVFIVNDLATYLTEDMESGGSGSTITESTVAGWGFTKNTGTYSKPSGGIPKTDLESAVQTSLGKADTALQSFTETDPTVPSWAKASTKPSYTASEVGALPDTYTPPVTSVNGQTGAVTIATGDINVIESISVNGVAQTIANKNVNLPIVTIYSGSSAPSNSLGSDGDIYIKTVS